MFHTGVLVHVPRDHVGHDGLVVEGRASVQRYLDNGFAMLPYDLPRTQEMVGGYYRRGWGDGIAIDTRPERVCPMMLRLVPERSWVYWTAVVQAWRPNAAGEFRLLAANVPGMAMAGAGMTGVGDDAVRVLIDEKGSEMVIGGRRKVSAPDPAWVGFELLALSGGLKVLVSAVSQSEIDVAYP